MSDKAHCIGMGIFWIVGFWGGIAYVWLGPNQSGSANWPPTILFGLLSIIGFAIMAGPPDEEDDLPDTK